MNQHMVEVIGAGLAAGIVLSKLSRRARRMLKRKWGDPLDHVVAYWAKNDPLTVRDLLRSVAIYGQTGSGKSSSSGLMLAQAIVNYGNSGGLILASKPEDREWWERRFAIAGRSDDLYVMEPRGTKRCNVLDHEMKKGADTSDLTQYLMTMQETVNRAQGNTSREPFWADQNRRMIHNAIEIISLARGTVSPWDLQTYVAAAPANPAVFGSIESITDEATKKAAEAFQKGIHYQALGAAWTIAHQRGGIAKHDYLLAKEYWMREIPGLNDRTKSSIMAGVLGLLHVFNTGVVHDQLCTETNVSPDDMENRKWILVNWPIVAGDASSTFVNAAMKFLTQRHIMRRKAGPNDPILGIYCDEFPKVANSYDTAFLAECRSHKGYMITLAQSVPGMVEAMGGKYENASALLCNQYNKVFHTLGEAQTAEFASSLLGNRLETMMGGSQPAGGTLGEQLFGRSNHSASFSSSYQPVLQPAALMGGMRCGGPKANYLVDGWLIREGTYRQVAFSQK